MTDSELITEVRNIHGTSPQLDALINRFIEQQNPVEKVKQRILDPIPSRFTLEEWADMVETIYTNWPQNQWVDHTSELRSVARILRSGAIRVESSKRWRKIWI